MQLKTTIIFNLDYDIVEKLKKLENRSSFLNKLLRDHYDEQEFNNMSKEEAERQLKRLDILERHIQELKEFDNGK